MDKTVRYDNIDFLRATFIFGVLLFHFFIRWEPPFETAHYLHLDNTYSSLFEYGSFGVEFFFVISGLVIAMTVEKCQNWWTFLYKRLSRIYPAFLVALFFTATLWAFLGHRYFGPIEIIANIFFVPSFLSQNSNITYVDGVYWSLAVELKFYVIVAIGFAALGRRYWMLAVALGAFSGIGSLTHLLPNGVVDKILLAKYMPLFLYGMGLYAWAFEMAPRKSSILITAACLLFLIQARSFPLHDGSWLASFLFIALGCVAIGYIVVGRVALAFAPISYLGRISYSLYLLHQIMGVFLIAHLKAFGLPDLLAISAAIAVSLCLAAISYHFVEQPSQRFLRLFQGRLADRFSAWLKRKGKPPFARRQKTRSGDY